MITSIHLKNWQCWEDLVLELAPITVLAADNDRGKSAVIRALKWLCLNKWDGKAEEYITHGQEVCEVVCQVDLLTVGRKRQGGKQEYSLGDEVFTAFGSKIPEPISKTLNISSDSFQDQQDPAFWLLLNSGQAAQALNEIFNLQEIDSTISNVSAESRKAKARVSVSRERLLKARQERKQLEWVDRADEQLQELEELWQKIQQNDQQINSLEEHLIQLTSLSGDLRSLSKSLEYGLIALQCGKLLQKCMQEMQCLQTILDKEEELCRLERELVKKQTLLGKWQEERCPLCGK